MAKLVLMDIDGVLAPLGAVAGDPLVVRSTWVTWVIKRSIADWFCGLTDKVDVMWASTWQDEVAPLNEALGIKLPFLEFDRDDGTEWFKTSRIRQFLEENDYETIVWVDDEHDAASQSLTEEFAELEVVTPDPAKGLNLHNVLQIHELLEVAP